MQLVPKKLKIFYNDKKDKIYKKSKKTIRKSQKAMADLLLIWASIFGRSKSLDNSVLNQNQKNHLSCQRIIKNEFDMIDTHELDFLDENNYQVLSVKETTNPIIPPSRGSKPSNFPSVGRPNCPVSGINPYRTTPKVVPQGFGAGGNPTGPGGATDENFEFKKEESKNSDYDFPLDDRKKKKESAEQCSLDEQNKGGNDELPDSFQFIYRLEGKSAKKEFKKVWKNDEAKKEVLAGLNRMDRRKLLPQNVKALQGFKNLKKIKLTNTRIIVNPGKGGTPEEIIGIVMRRHLKAFTKGLDKKFP